MLVASYKFEIVEMEFSYFFISFISLRNLQTLMKVQKSQHLMLANISRHKIIIWRHFFIYRSISISIWCNGYRRRKWTRRHEFKSWTRVIAFHIALIPLGKVWIQLFSLRLWVNSRATSLGEGKLWIQTC